MAKKKGKKSGKKGKKSGKKSASDSSTEPLVLPGGGDPSQVGHAIQRSPAGKC